MCCTFRKKDAENPDWGPSRLYAPPSQGRKREGMLRGVQTGTSHWKCLQCELGGLADLLGPSLAADLARVSVKLKVRPLTRFQICALVLFF